MATSPDELLATDSVRIESETAIIGLVARIDGYLSEEHDASVRLSSYPVESGASLTDHAVRQPNVLKLVGWVSDLLRAETADRTTPLQERGALAWAEIDRMMNTRDPVIVLTRFGVYSDMLITRASAPVNDQTGRGLQVSLELQQVVFRPLTVSQGGLSLSPRPDGPAADRAQAAEPRTGETTPALIGVVEDLIPWLKEFGTNVPELLGH